MTKEKIHDIIIKKGKPSLGVRNFSRSGSRAKMGNSIIKKKGKFVFGILIFFLLLIFSAKVVDIFAHAVIKVSLHKEVVAVDTILKSSQSTFDLPFESMQLQVTEEKNTKATGVETITTKASGEINIFNSFSSASQKLVARTRFETPDGKIYRIKNSVVVPGAEIVNGKVNPQSIKVRVYADEPGENYNISLTDFTIPGFKGGPRYEKFYARSVTLMTGGFEGERPIVSEQDEASLKNSLELSISEKLLAKSIIQKPEGFLLYEEATKITFSENLAENKSDSEFTMKETGTLLGGLISKKALSRALVKKYLGEEFQGKVVVANLENLVFELVTLELEKETMIFKLSGEAEFVWEIDEERLKEALLASPKDLENVFKNYSEIDQASIVFKPSWWRFFPDKISKIKIEHVSE